MLILILILLFCLEITPFNVISKSQDDAFMLIEFEKFIESFNKVYNGSNEKLERFQIWKKNTHLIDEHNEQANLGKLTFWLKMNRFGDLVCLSRNI